MNSMAVLSPWLILNKSITALSRLTMASSSFFDEVVISSYVWAACVAHLVVASSSMSWNITQTCFSQNTITSGPAGTSWSCPFPGNMAADSPTPLLLPCSTTLSLAMSKGPSFRACYNLLQLLCCELDDSLWLLIWHPCCQCEIASLNLSLFWKYSLSQHSKSEKTTDESLT